MPDLSLIVPFLNEEENLADLVKQLNQYAKTQEFTIEVIFVDDGSTDSSVQILRTTESSVPLILVSLSKNFGSHAAIRAGLTRANGRYVMFFLADLQNPFSLIGDMYKKASEGYEIVAARKTAKQVSLFERFYSSIYTALIRKFALPDYPKGGVDNFLFSRKIKDIICENVESNSSIFMQLINMGFRRAIIDASFDKRQKGKSKWTLSRKIKLFIDSFIAFSYTPIRLISVMGIVLFIFGALYALWIIIARLTGIFDFDLGFPTLISVLLLGFGLTNFSLGVVAEYVWRTLDSARGRPVFIIDTVEELSGGEGK